MKYLRWVGLMPCLLIVGALGELMAPLPSHALTVTINGSSFSTSPRGCDAGFTTCLTINPGTVAGGTWRVGNAPGTTARVMIADLSTANSLDRIKLTGITLEPVIAQGTKTATVRITHTFNAGGGNPAGNYAWGYGMAGQFDPPPTENIVNDRLQQTANGNFAGVSVTMGSGLDTGLLKIPSTNDLTGSVTKPSVSSVVRSPCNTGSNRCAPTVTLTFTITVVGADKLVLTDSVIGCGGTCRQVDEIIPIDPFLYKLMLKLDPTAPNDINKLSAWLAKMGQKYAKNEQQLKALKFLIGLLDAWLEKTVPGTCPEILEEINDFIERDMERERVAAAAAGAVAASPGGTITITKNTSQATSETFTFDISGPSSSTEPIAMEDQSSESIVVTVLPGTYSITENERAGWSLTSASCTVEDGSTLHGPPLTNIVVPEEGNVTCTFNNNKTFNSDDYRVISSPGLTWAEARAAAQALGAGWDLATITSQEEQNFIQTLLPPNPREIPGTHDYWIAGEQPSGSTEPGGTWQWATDGFVFYDNGVTSGGYANWGTTSTGPDNEPNNLGNENHVTLDNRYGWGWNDLNRDGGTQGFVAKRVIPPPPCCGGGT